MPRNPAPRWWQRLAQRPTLGPETTTWMLAAWLASVGNLSLLQRIAASPESSPALLLASWGLLVGANVLLLSLLAWPGVLKPAKAVVVMAAAAAAFFMDGYGAVIDRHAVQSALETDWREGSSWLSWSMVLQIIGIAALPLLVLARARIEFPRWPRLLVRRAVSLAVAGLLMTAAVLPLGRDFASLARNHGELRHLANPFNLANALRGYAKHAGLDADAPLQTVAGDARPGAPLQKPHKPLLLVLVVGESARAASFHLDGYARQTTPEIEQLHPVNFGAIDACGTNTATSVPCMFSDLGQDGFDEGVARHRENLLDVIARSGIAVEWEDNNTGSKHVADRVKEEHLNEYGAAEQCSDTGCFDQVLVDHLQAEMQAPPRDKVFVLHQLGSHGPSYHQRYPPVFERFTPACHSNVLQDCSSDEVRNTYDNTILYTDHILGELVRLLQQQGDTRETALLYVSDHGESTGEHGLYLHGAPRVMAPAEQTRVPMLFWASDSFLQWRGLSAQCLGAHDHSGLSHDHYFHSVLGLLGVDTAAYRRDRDVFADCVS